MAKRKIEWSIEAKDSLQEILDFNVERNGSKYYSSKLLHQIKNTISFLGTNNFIGKRTDEYQIRVLFKSHYSIFYELKEKVIETLLIRDNRRNPDDIQI